LVLVVAAFVVAAFVVAAFVVAAFAVAAFVDGAFVVGAGAGPGGRMGFTTGVEAELTEDEPFLSKDVTTTSRLEPTPTTAASLIEGATEFVGGCRPGAASFPCAVASIGNETNATESAAAIGTAIRVYAMFPPRDGRPGPRFRLARRNGAMTSRRSRGTQTTGSDWAKAEPEVRD
jgi:hypothetical protein